MRRLKLAMVYNQGAKPCPLAHTIPQQMAQKKTHRKANKLLKSGTTKDTELSFSVISNLL